MPTSPSPLFFSHAGFLQIDVQPAALDGNMAQVQRGLAALCRNRPAGAQLLVALPELWATGFAYRELPRLSERLPDVFSFLEAQAAEHDVFLAGSLPEPVAGAEKKFHNTLYCTTPTGSEVLYRKQHLFVPMGEDISFVPADDPPLPQTSSCGPLGGLVCYDLRFPELAKLQAGHGVRLLLVSAQWPKVRTEHWRTLLQARAIENQLFVVAANRTGSDPGPNGLAFAGHSMVIGPDGTILTEAGFETGCGLAALDPELLDTVRSRFNTVGPAPHRLRDEEKIVDLQGLLPVAETMRQVGKIMVFTMARGNALRATDAVRYEEARRRGDCLVVGIGEEKKELARLLAGLGCVDQVVLLGDETPNRFLSLLGPGIVTVDDY